MLNLAVTPVEKRDPSTVILLKKYLTEANITSIDPENVSLKDIKEMRKTADKAAKQYPLKTRIYAKTQEIKKKRDPGQGFFDGVRASGMAFTGIIGGPIALASWARPDANETAMLIGASVAAAILVASTVPYASTSIANKLTEPKGVAGEKIYQDYKAIRNLQKTLKKVKNILTTEAKKQKEAQKEAKTLKSSTFLTTDNLLNNTPLPIKQKTNQEIVQDTIKKRQQAFGK